MIRSFLFLVFLLGGFQPGVTQSAGSESELAFGDEEIEEIITRSCGDSGYAFQRYRGGLGYDFEFEGPLYLTTAGEKEAFGVLLTPFLRLHQYADSRSCEQVSLSEARELAKSEIWVVLWRMEDPPRPYSGRIASGGRVLIPTEVRWRFEGDWHHPIWTRDRHSKIAAWFARDWNEKESLIAAFPRLEKRGALWVDFKVVEKGGGYHPADTKLFSLDAVREKWWRAAFGEVAEP